jgi:hypothetical protein
MLAYSSRRLMAAFSVALVFMGCGKNNASSSQTGGVRTSLPKALATPSNPIEATARLTQRSQAPTIEESSAFPPALVASVKKNFPGYRIPIEADLTGHWAEREHAGAPPFACKGDFNGDGLTDAAIILLGKNVWRLVIFVQGSNGDFFPAHVARPKMRAELPKVGEDTSIAAPQEVILKTIEKGQVWAPEGGDQPYEVKLRADGIIFEHFKKLRFAELDETTLIEYKDGQFRQSNVLELLVPIEMP